jgi:hypothetical protein
MGVDPKDEDITDLIPHVAAVAAAYGDSKEKYAAFLAKTTANYKTMPFWFYDQTLALSSSPAAATAHKRRTTWAREDHEDVVFAVQPKDIFKCPQVFSVDPEVELDNGIFVTCDELKPFYDIL